MNLTLKKSETKSRIIFLKCLESNGRRDYPKFPLTPTLSPKSKGNFNSTSMDLFWSFPAMGAALSPFRIRLFGEDCLSAASF